MALKRTTVFADEDDLAVIKAAARRRGVAEAEILRNAIHLAAMSDRLWEEPFFSRTYEPLDRTPSGGSAAADEQWAGAAAAYERTKSRPG